MFYLFAALMLLVGVVFVCWPLMRKPEQQSALSNEASNLEAFRVQRREVEAEHARGLVTDAERDQVIDELSVRLAAEVDVETKPEQTSAVSAKNASKRPWIVATLLSIFVVGASTVGYAVLGAHHARKVAAIVAASPAANTDPNAPPSEQQVLALVESLAKKMEANPDDPKGWVLLARSQNALGQWAAAAKAFERAVTLLPDDAQLLADYADVQAMVQEGSFAGKPMALTQRALKLDPKNMKALALAGTAEMRAGNKAQSLKYWERLLAIVPKDSDDATQVAAIVAEIKTGKSAAPAAAQAGNAAPPLNTTAPAGAASPGKSVAGEISIAPALVGKIAKSDTLFVFARAASGPRMPLAVLRIPVPSAWPFKFELTDAMAMAPGMSLSSFAEVVIEARISKGGSAPLQAGDLQGLSAPVAPPLGGLKIVIDKVAP
jgi:cytochrome c-type biogenesis protein CcmH